MVSVAVSKFGVAVRSSGAAMRAMRMLAARPAPVATAGWIAGVTGAGWIAGGGGKRCVSTVHLESPEHAAKHTRPFTSRSGAKNETNERPAGNKVVVIGGGYAGIEAAKRLDKAFDVALVAGGESFRHVMYGLRASVLPEQAPKMLVPYDNLLKNGTVKTCKASKINADECTVTLASGESLPYDYLVLATGYLHPKTPGFGNRAVTNADQTTVFKQACAELQAAQKILIIGGGPVGIEMAGEIMEEMRGKSVTLVTSKELMPAPTVTFSATFRTRLRQKLEEVGVTVHTDGGRIDFSPKDINACGFIPGKKTYSWTGGEMEADLCIVCTGATQPASLYADSGLEAWLNEKGQLKVADTLEVKEAPGTGKIFAIGDCADLAVPKLGFLAGMEGANVAKQITASAAGKPLKSGKPPAIPISMVPVGKNGGVSYLPIGVAVGDFMTKKMKSEDVFLWKYWSDLGAGKPPVV